MKKICTMYLLRGLYAYLTTNSPVRFTNIIVGVLTYNILSEGLNMIGLITQM